MTEANELDLQFYYMPADPTMEARLAYLINAKPEVKCSFSG